MNPLAIEIKLTGNLPVEGICGKCRDSSLCYNTAELDCAVMNDETWEKVVEFMTRINYAGEIDILGNVEKDPQFPKKWDSIKKFCNKKNPAWIHINWKYINDDIIDMLGDNLRLVIRFGPYTFDNFTIEKELISVLDNINAHKKKYLLTVRIIEPEKSIDEIMCRFDEIRARLYHILNNAGFANAAILHDSLCFEMCLSDETDLAWNKLISVQACIEEIPLVKAYGYTDPVYDKISKEICSSPMILTYINWNGDISRCCMDYNCKKSEGNIHNIRPENLFQGAEYCNYPVKCYEERPL